ncbi:MAG TPA: enoyl-CoA hydratase-related protein [Bradyrhizobium sp.]|nr:enoyl-CoA hydratase-related protein [Bradyrhizobium sp.]
MSNEESVNPLVLRTVENGIGTITLNRPRESNAMTQQLWEEILQTLNEFAANDSVRVIVITGAGKAFCAGADIARLKKWAAGGEIDLPMTKPSPKVSNGLDLPSGFDDRFSYITQVPKPIIAAINGPAVGSGFALAMYSDIRFATPGAKFSVAFARLGLIGEMALPWLLSRVAAPHVAADMLFSSRIVSGEEAAQLGLINRTFPEADFLPSVYAYAKAMVEITTPWSLAKMKQQLYRGLVQSLDEAVNEYYPLMDESLHREDFIVRLKAMLSSIGANK